MTSRFVSGVRNSLRVAPVVRGASACGCSAVSAAAAAGASAAIASPPSAPGCSSKRVRFVGGTDEDADLKLLPLNAAKQMLQRSLSHAVHDAAICPRTTPGGHLLQR